MLTSAWVFGVGSQDRPVSDAVLVAHQRHMSTRWSRWVAPFLLSTTPIGLLGQTSADCFSAIPVCQGTYSEANSPEGEGGLPDEIDPVLSCLGGGEVDGQWYTFTVQNSGQFCFSIVPNNLANDYDWAVFNLTNASCEDIATNGSLEVSCNFSGTPGVTGANNQSGLQNNPCIPVQLGQTYVLYISNWSQSPFGYTLNTQIPGSTASIFDSAAPTLLGTVGTECTRTELEVTFSELVLCSSVQLADFSISGPGGPVTVTGVTSAECAAGGDQSNTYQLTVAPPLVDGGNYTISMIGTVLDLCGNQSEVGTNVVFPMSDQLTLTATSEPSGCGGAADGSVLGTASGGDGALIYRLNGADPQVNNGAYDGLVGGTYVVSVTDANTCQATAQVEVVQSNSDMMSTVQTTDITCNGGNDGMIIARTIGSNGVWSYRWIDANGTTVQTTAGVAQDTLRGGPGTYEVIVTEGVSGADCSDTLAATIMEPTPLSFSTVPVDTTICLTGSAFLEASAEGGTGAIVLNWSNGLSGQGPHTVSPSVDQAYSVQAEDANGCLSTVMTSTVAVNSAITFDALTDLTECRGVPFTLQVADLEGGDGNYSYLWNNGASTGPVLLDSLYDDATLCVTVSDGCETPAVSSCATVTILQTPPMVMTVDSSVGCAPFEVRYALQDTTESARIQWDFGDGVITEGPDTIDHIYSDPGHFTVSATATWPNGCVTDTTIFHMTTAVQVPIPDFVWTPDPLTIFEPVAHFRETAGPNEISYAWDFFAFGTSDGPDTTITFPNDEGRYYPVQLIVTNALGCADTLLRLVHVEDQFLVYVPNAFSPDGDGMNEFFRVEGNDISPDEFRLYIFDRWGKEVFASEDPLEAWSGRLGGNEGEPLPQGVYSWRLTIRSKQTLQKRILMGHVTLLR